MNQEITAAKVDRKAMIRQSTSLEGVGAAERVSEPLERPTELIRIDEEPSSSADGRRRHICHHPRSRNYALSESETRPILIQLEDDLPRGPGETWNPKMSADREPTSLVSQPNG
jgi:hypothetical protein